ncbi:MAG: hypothetical protein EOQ47_32550, partial [Mesorhizobium sp.]
MERVISPLVGEMAGRPEGGAVPPGLRIWFLAPAKAGERCPRSGRRGGLRRALPLSVRFADTSP